MSCDKLPSSGWYTDALRAYPEFAKSMDSGIAKVAADLREQWSLDGTFKEMSSWWKCPPANG